LKHATSNFSRQKMVDDYLEVYSEFLRSKTWI
jgi:hypothetical protein